jgi:hypothetical protein
MSKVSNIPKPVVIKKNNYFIVNDIRKYDEDYFQGCSAGIRTIIAKRKIPKNMYIYAYSRYDVWVMGNPSYSKSKLLLNAEWVYKNVPEMKKLKKKIDDEEKDDEEKDDEEKDDDNDADVPKIKIKKNKKEESDEEESDEEESDEEKSDEEKSDEEKNISDEEKDISDEEKDISDEEKEESNEGKVDSNDEIKNIIKKAPPVLKLENKEKFINAEGEILEIDVRGERDPDKCYFKASDTGTAFNIKNISGTLYKSSSSFKVKIHYKNFIVKNPDKKRRKTLYLTFYGLIKLLFVMRSKCAEHFQKWAYKKLFIIQMGKPEEKQELAAKLIGVSSEVVKHVFIKGVSTTPSVYLCLLGTVKELRKIMKIDDDIPDTSLVCKFGFTKDTPQRLDQHNDEYGSITKKHVELLLYSYIDPTHISHAETDIKNFFKLMNVTFEYKNYTELVIITKKQLDGVIKKEYTKEFELYGGFVKEIVGKIDLIKEEHKSAIHENNWLHEKEINKYEKEINKYEKEINKREKEISDLKIKFLESKIKK